VNARSLPVLLALLTAPSVAEAKGRADDPPPLAEPTGGQPSPAQPAVPATGAAPSVEPSAAPQGPAGAPTVTIGGDASPAAAKDEPAAQAEEKKESTLPFRGSAIVFDQSMTTQTAHLDTSPQLSYVPLYEWWISFRPRWYFNEHLYLWARFDYYKELTNSQETTLYRQDVFGDIWSDLRYTSAVPAINKNFKATAGIRAKWPTSLESQGNGIYITPGVFGSAQQKITINGASAKTFNEAELSASVTYEHPFSRATTPTNPSLHYARQSTDERSFTFLDNQLSGQMLVNHTLLASLHAGLNITPKLSTSLDMIWINQWHYPSTGDVTVPLAGGGVFVPRSADDTIFTQRTWFIANVSYDLFDEMSLGLGYYNLASVIAPNGQRRGIAGGDVVWWSPDARVFFDVTVNLDRFYEFVSGAKGKNEQKPTPAQRTADRVRAFSRF
jgi:hypothetical protein